jgi:hypothetical protein
MDNGPRPSAWLAETTPRSKKRLKARELALHESWFSLETRKTAIITPLYRKEDLMYLANKDADDEAFKDLETLERAKKSIMDYRNPVDVKTEYNLYKKGTEELQQKLAELEASYSIVCEHSVKLEKALKETKRQLDQAQKSWFVAMLMRFGLMK